MLVYLITGVIAIFFAFLYDSKQIKFKAIGKFNSNFFLFFSFLVLFIVSGLRYNVGTDYVLYNKMQIPIILDLKEPDYWQVTNYEIGFQYLVKLANTLFNNTILFFVIVAVIFIFFMYKFIKENSLSTGISVYIFITSYFYNFSFNVMRQALATSIFIYSIKYIEQKNFKKYFILICFATLFHWASLIYIPLYFLLEKKWNNTVQMFLIFISLIFQNVIRNILLFVSLKLGFYSSYFGGSLDTGDKLPFFIILIISLIYAYRLFFIKKNTCKDNIYSNLEFLSILVAVNGSIIPTGYRVMYMFFPVVIVSIPYWYAKTRGNKFSRLYFCILLVSLLFYYIYMVPVHNYGETLPYQTLLSEPRGGLSW